MMEENHHPSDQEGIVMVRWRKGGGGKGEGRRRKGLVKKEELNFLIEVCTCTVQYKQNKKLIRDQ